MRELIRKILREESNIERIKKNEKEIPSRVPTIVRFIKSK
jgi:hypothetical protein